jgi:hypothetical protein
MPPRRFDLPITLGLLEVTTNHLRPQIIYLAIAEKSSSTCAHPL